MPSGNFCNSEAAPAVASGYFFETVRPPSAAAPRNTGTEPDEPARAFVTDLWEKALAELPGVFARLVFLAGLRDGTNGEYSHYGLELPLGRGAASVIRRSHENAFQEWLLLTLEEQHADFHRFLAGAPGYRRQAFRDWSDFARFAFLVPDSAGEHERALFFAEMHVIVVLGEADGRGFSVLKLLAREA